MVRILAMWERRFKADDGNSRERQQCCFQPRCSYCNHKMALAKVLRFRNSAVSTDTLLRDSGEVAMKILLKFLILGASLAAGTAARKASAAGWRKGTENEPPKDADDLNNPLAEVLVFALVKAATGSLIQVITHAWHARPQLNWSTILRSPNAGQEGAACERLAVNCGDFVTLLGEDTVVRLIRRLRPEIYAKDGNYSSDTLEEAEDVRVYDSPVEMFDYVPDHSTTDLVEKMVPAGPSTAGFAGGASLRLASQTAQPAGAEQG